MRLSGFTVKSAAQRYRSGSASLSVGMCFGELPTVGLEAATRFLFTAFLLNGRKFMRSFNRGDRHINSRLQGESQGRKPLEFWCKSHRHKNVRDC